MNCFVLYLVVNIKSCIFGMNFYCMYNYYGELGYEFYVNNLDIGILLGIKFVYVFIVVENELKY